jgi:uncharacterized protein (TIGR03435 family)
MNSQSSRRFVSVVSAFTTAGIIAGTIATISGVANMFVLHAQSTQKFEVASIRRVEVASTTQGVPVFPITGGIGTSSPGRITYRATWLPRLIEEAFDLRSDQIAGPAWLSTERYDIVANIPEGSTKDDFKQMLANLLRERFHLEFHMSSKTRPVYVLRAGREGPKVILSKRTGEATRSAGEGSTDAHGCVTVPASFRGAVSRPAPGVMCWTAQDITMAELAALLEQPAGRPIIDETGLTGRYDFRIRYQAASRSPDVAAVEGAPGVFTAVEEQLGLKLEPATRSFPELIIDSIDREPTND